MKLAPKDIITRLKRYWRRLPAYLTASLYICLSVSCNIDRPPEECNYNVHVTYRYNREISDRQNSVNTYMQTLNEYIYDQDGTLFQKNVLPGISCDGKYVSELTLPEGKYTVVSWGNTGGPSRTNHEIIGVSKLSEMQLYLDPDYFTKSEPEKSGDKTYMSGNSEKLFYGYRTFSVGSTAISHVVVDMFHSHCKLSVTIGWKMGAPAQTKDFTMVYNDVNGTYAFRPMHMVKKEVWHDHDSSADDFLPQCSDYIHYSPRRQNGSQLTSFRKDVKMNVDKKVKAEFITYRYNNDSPLVLSLYAGDRQVMKDIDLQRFFSEMSIDLDRNFRQEFDLYMEIDEDKVTVSFVNVNDWEEGGYIGGW